MSTGAILIFLFFLGVVLNGLFAGYETGFVSCNPIRVRHLAEKKKRINAIRLLAFLEYPDRMLTVVLLGTNLALILGTVSITRYFDNNSLWATLVATPTYLIFAEILPKSVFRIHPTRLSLRLLPVIRFFDALFLPLLLPVNLFSGWLRKSLEGDGEGGIPVLMRSPEDMRVLVDESADKGTIEEEEKEMIHSVMDLQTRFAKEVMVPRIDIQALPESATRGELIAVLKESGRTRIPIFRESIDQIVGVVNAFDVLKDEEPGREDIGRFIEDIMHVHDTMKLDDALQVLRDQRQSMAIVTDEYGGTDGLITIEDIIEEIFGEIQDEYDREETAIRKVGSNEYVIEARTPLEDVSEVIGATISDEEVETVGGWLMHVIARIPKAGEVIEEGRFRVTVLDAGPNCVSNVRLEVLAENEAGDE